MGKSNQSKELKEFELNARRWKNRRRMAWLAFFSILAVTYYMIVVIDETRIELLNPIITWFYTVMGSVICAYCGLATLEDIKFKENE